MQKIVIEKTGSYDQLKLQEFFLREPVENEILIEVYACGVNFADACVRMGVYRSANELASWPITPGFEVAGIVKAIGPGVKKFAIGQRVVALTFFGGYASCVKVSEDYAFNIPERLTFIEAAAIPAVFLTAYYALFELVHPKPNDLLLVHSAAGGVGSALMQLGKMAGCRVVGVVGASHKVDVVKSFCPLAVIDKSKQDLWKEAENLAPLNFDAVFDANGVETLKKSYHHLRPGGKLVVYGFHTMLSKGRGTVNWFKAAWDYLRTPRFNPLDMTHENRSVLAFNLSYLFDRTELLKDPLEKILGWFAEGALSPPPIKTYPLEKAGDAHKDLESGMTVGKLVLTVNSN
jgi:synaptic vesicle membrane protein VAT-1